MPTRRLTKETLCLLMFATAIPCERIAAQLEGVRVFTTPAERQRLDSQRSGGTKPARADMETTLPATPATVELQGIVMRSNGSHAVWINDSNALCCGRTVGGLRVRAGEAGMVRVEIPDRGIVVLAPGQSYDRVSGKTSGIRVQRSQ